MIKITKKDVHSYYLGLASSDVALAIESAAAREDRTITNWLDSLAPSVGWGDDAEELNHPKAERGEALLDIHSKDFLGRSEAVFIDLMNEVLPPPDREKEPIDSK